MSVEASTEPKVSIDNLKFRIIGNDCVIPVEAVVRMQLWVKHCDQMIEDFKDEKSDFYAGVRVRLQQERARVVAILELMRSS